MKESIDISLQTIEDHYKICLRIIGKYFDYLETCSLKEFNKYSKYKWSYDRDKTNGYSYVCIRYRSSLMKKCLVKKRAYIEKDDLYKWVQNKELIQEALDEAYQYITTKISAIATRLEDIKEFAEDYEGKLEGVSEDFEKIKSASKKLGSESGVFDEDDDLDPIKPPEKSSPISHILKVFQN
jgi:hypothetical protein